MQAISDVEQLSQLCKELRRDILDMVYIAGSGHIGGSFSATELMSVLFFNVMHHDPQNPQDENRDRFILSKGHCTPIYYSILAHCDYFPHEELQSFRKIDSRLQGHPDKSKFPLMESTSGSLGQGLSIAAGMAFALRLKNIPAKIYCLMGDGELDEGQVWESFATINKYKLSNLIIIIDHNNIQLGGSNEDIKNLEPLKEKFTSFGFTVLEVDGHTIPALLEIFTAAKKESDEGKCMILIAHTIKGKGVSFMENTAFWHGIAPNKEEYEKAMQELE
ncbi:MAG: transketolase [Candidatus Woesearchaeota archaeon]